jgi:hypothetical protein
MPTRILSASGLGAGRPAIVNVNPGQMAATALSQAQPYSMSLAMKRAATSGFWQFWGGSPTGSIFSDSGAAKSDLFAGSTSAGFATTDNAYNAIQATFNGASSEAYSGGTQTTGLNPSTGGTSIPTLYQTGFPPTAGQAFVLEAGIWAGDQSANNATMESNQKTYWGF